MIRAFHLFYLLVFSPRNLFVFTFLFSFLSYATPAYVPRSNDGIVAALPGEAGAGLPVGAPNDCRACHAAAGPPVNTFGAALAAAAAARGYGNGVGNGWSNEADPVATVFQNLFTDVLDEDSDGDTHTNRDEFIARSNPGDPASVPGGIGPSGPGELELLDLSEAEASENSGMLSSCGGGSKKNAALGMNQELTLAQSFELGGWTLLLWLFPLILLVQIRRTKEQRKQTSKIEDRKSSKF